MKAPVSQSTMPVSSGWPFPSREQKPWTRWWWMGSAVDARVHLVDLALRESLLRFSRPLVLDVKGLPPKPSCWNQACYKFTAGLEQDPNANGSVSERDREIRTTVLFWTNEDMPPPSVGEPITGKGRKQEMVYRLIYDLKGEVIPNGSLGGVRQDWQSMKILLTQDGVQNPPVNGYAFGYVGLLNTPYAHWKQGAHGENKNVTFDRLRALGIDKNVW